MCLAIPGQIISISGAEPLFRQARVDFGGIVKAVSLACTPEAAVGQYVLVHAGIAIALIQEDEAHQIFAYLAAMGEIDEIRR